MIGFYPTTTALSYFDTEFTTQTSLINRGSKSKVSKPQKRTYRIAQIRNNPTARRTVQARQRAFQRLIDAAASQA